MVRALAQRLFGKFLAGIVNGWIFAGTAIAAESDVAETGNGVVDLKIVIAVLLVGAIIAFAHRGANRAAG